MEIQLLEKQAAPWTHLFKTHLRSLISHDPSLSHGLLSLAFFSSFLCFIYFSFYLFWYFIISPLYLYHPSGPVNSLPYQTLFITAISQNIFEPISASFFIITKQLLFSTLQSSQTNCLEWLNPYILAKEKKLKSTEPNLHPTKQTSRDPSLMEPPTSS